MRSTLFNVFSPNCFATWVEAIPFDANVSTNDAHAVGLGWQPRYDFRSVLEKLRAGEDPRSPLAQAVGSKGYHGQEFADGPYPAA